MNEFIVWDDKLGKFLEPMSIEQLAISKPLEDKFIMANWQICNYIGKTDINNKKIYANCSIVEFDFEDCVFSYSGRGYFTYNEEFCYYELIDFAGRSYSLKDKTIKNLKIIDTIQENKLGLIKS